MFKRYLLLFLLSTSSIFADSLDSLLEEYEKNTQESLYTLDEKLGNVTIYSQREIRLMQYTTLSDLLKEFPLSNLNKNRFGSLNLSLSGSKTDLSGFFRIFINDHEVSSSYTMSPSASWMEFPMDIVDYVEIYRGNSSFSLGSSDGVFFIRIYTKDSKKENASGLYLNVSDNASSMQGVSHSEVFENGWSYLAYASNVSKKDENTYKSNTLKNDSNSNYIYLNIQKDDTAVNFGYSYMDKENFTGLSLDVNPDDATYKTDDAFIDFSTLFLKDKSLEIKLSHDFNRIRYFELNDINPVNLPNDGIGVMSVVDVTDPFNTTPKEYNSDIKVNKSSALVSKKFNFFDNNLLIGANYQYKKYTLDDAYVVNFLNTKTSFESFSDFNKEKKYTLFLQDDYRALKNLLFILNLKHDWYDRDDNVEDEENTHYRVGTIYNPTNNFGIKAFYTKTSIAPSFYSVDNKSQFEDKLDTQKYEYSDLEIVYANNSFRLSLLYNNTKMDDFIYYAPVGFINVDHTIEVDNFVLDLKYDLFKNHELSFNIFRTNLSEEINNANEGAFLKFSGSFEKFEYFSSLIHRCAYSYYDVDVDESHNFNLGVTYKYSKDISLSLKAENILDDSTKSLYKEGLSQDASVGNFALEDYEPKVTFSTKWVF